jgi:hypothetical protein
MAAATIESTGAIDIRCNTHGLVASKKAQLTFHAWDDASPPVQLTVVAPSGQVILDRLLRCLPTGDPQAPPPITFSVLRGEYKITITELHGGKAQGKATLRVP